MRHPRTVLWAMIGAYAALFSYLSIQRHHAFWTGRFDIGNMVQAVWSTAQGRPLESTDEFGRQFVRLGAHVDPILAVFAPLTWTGHLPEALLISQALIVALGALPAYWLAVRWLDDSRLALVAAALYLLYPPLQWATLAEFHAVTLAAPLLLFAIWAGHERRWVWLAVFAVAAALTKEQVGLALAVLGLWLAVGGARRAGTLLAAGSLAWVTLCFAVIIPRFNRGDGSPFADRYAHLGEGVGGAILGVLTAPWDAVLFALSPWRLGLLAALLAPLLFAPLLAPLLAAGALPDLAINLLADRPQQHSLRYHYMAVAVPFLIAAAIAGAARLRERMAPLGDRALRRGAAAWIIWMVLCGAALGPIPWWSNVPGGSTGRADEYRPDDHARVLARAVAAIPDGEAVSAGNRLGGHLSERRRILLFPRIDDARWVITTERRPFVHGRLAPQVHAAHVRMLRADPRFIVVFDEDGAIVWRRVAPAGT